MSLKEMENFVSLCSDKVQKNVTIVSAKDLGQDYMLHISPDRMSSKPYVPQIGRRQADTEDRTVPRITVAPSLLGCYVGYAELITKSLEYTKHNTTFTKQGLYIHEIPFEHALKPTSRMVYDQRFSDEHWLVTYNTDTKEYKGKIIGKCFITEVRFTTRTGTHADIDATMLVEVNRPEGIHWTEKIFLTKGYWEIKGLQESWKEEVAKDKHLTITEISKSDYERLKSQTAALLSDNPQAPFLKW